MRTARSARILVVAYSWSAGPIDVGQSAELLRLSAKTQRDLRARLRGRLPPFLLDLENPEAMLDVLVIFRAGGSEAIEPDHAQPTEGGLPLTQGMRLAPTRARCGAIDRFSGRRRRKSIARLIPLDQHEPR